MNESKKISKNKNNYIFLINEKFIFLFSKLPFGELLILLLLLVVKYLLLEYPSNFVSLSHET